MSKITAVDHNFGPSKITAVDRNFGPSQITAVDRNFGPSKSSSNSFKENKLQPKKLVKISKIKVHNRNFEWSKITVNNRNFVGFIIVVNNCDFGRSKMYNIQEDH